MNVFLDFMNLFKFDFVLVESLGGTCILQATSICCLYFVFPIQTQKLGCILKCKSGINKVLWLLQL